MDIKIPKIIHQTWKSINVPNHWLVSQQSIKEMQPNWVYKLWTDDENLEFIQTKFPWFLTTYNSFEYGIQRADAIRYFILYDEYIKSRPPYSGGFGPKMSS